MSFRIEVIIGMYNTEKREYPDARKEQKKMQMITTFKTEPKKLTIKDIESFTENDAAAIAEEIAEIKEHTIYFVDMGGAFGYSVLVFKDGQHIRYANDYELHHRGKTHDELNAWYKRALSNKLFTDDEMAAPLNNYDEYKANQILQKR